MLGTDDVIEQVALELYPIVHDELLQEEDIYEADREAFIKGAKWFRSNCSIK